MVRLRTLSSEFHHPDDFKSGAILTMPYLLDFRAFQEYLDGDLGKLYSRNAGNQWAQDVTGARYYEASGNVGYSSLNLFRSVTRFYQAALWERNPTMLDDDPTLQALWKEHSPWLIRQARKATEWIPAKGRAVLTIERKYPNNLVVAAVDPVFFVPIVDKINRDLEIGCALIRLWYDGTRLPQHDIPNRITVEIEISEEQAARSDGRVEETHEVRTFSWAGQATGAIGGRIGDPIGNSMDNARLMGVWTLGDDDSLFATMERGVYEAVLSLSHARTSLTQEVRATQLIPNVTDPAYTGPLTETEKIKRLLHPQYQVQVDDATGGTGLGFQDAPGPIMADAFLRLYEVTLNNLAYSCNIPPEAFGLNAMPGEPAEMYTKIQQVFATQIGDARDDLSTILSEMFEMLTGVVDADIGWELEVFGNVAENDDRAIKLKNAGIISTATAQIMTNSPKEDIDNGDNQRESGEQSVGLDGQSPGESEGTQDRPVGESDVQQGE